MKCGIRAVDSSLLQEILQKKIFTMGVSSLPADQVRHGGMNDWGLDLALPVDWECTKVANRMNAFKLNSFVFLDGFYQEYASNKDKASADVIKRYILDWIDHVPPYKSELKHDFWPYHDDATANRMLRFCIFYPGIRAFLSEQEKMQIKASMADQAALLATDEFYTKYHNHGMHQDMALLAYGLTMASGELRQAYVTKALTRMIEYIEYVYTSDGIHKEHSPSYAMLAIQDMIFVCDLIKDAIPEIYEILQRYKDNAYDVLCHLMKPDGKLPPIGDSLEKDGKNWLSRWFGEVKPHRQDAVYRQGGYAVFRSADDASWLLFNCATFSSTHKHGDDLEVLLYHKGDIFVEGGHRSYNYQDSETAWSYSGYAHNVLLIDEKPYPVKVSKNGKQNIYAEALQTRIVDNRTEQFRSEAKGICLRHKGIVQYREVRFDRTEKRVSVMDAIHSKNVCRGTLLWHLGTGIQIKARPHGFVLFRNHERVAIIDFSSSREMKIACIKNGTYPWLTQTFNGARKQSGLLLRVDFPIITGKNTVTMSVRLL